MGVSVGEGGVAVSVAVGVGENVVVGEGVDVALGVGVSTGAKVTVGADLVGATKVIVPFDFSGPCPMTAAG